MNAPVTTPTYDSITALMRERDAIDARLASEIEAMAATVSVDEMREAARKEGFERKMRCHNLDVWHHKEDHRLAQFPAIGGLDDHAEWVQFGISRLCGVDSRKYR